MTLASTGEFGLIQRVTARLGTAPTTLLGPATTPRWSRRRTAGSSRRTDVLVEGRHFRCDWASATDIGHRAAAANLADIAAMGGVADGVAGRAVHAAATSTRAGPSSSPTGSRPSARSVGAAVVGGDMSASPVITIAVTALGDLDGRAPVLRSGARPGDIVAMAGRIGHAAAGLHGAVARVPVAEGAGRGVPPAGGAVLGRAGRGRRSAPPP